MAKQTPILKKSFQADSIITSANLALTMSLANPDNVTLPPAAGATKFIGISDEPTMSNFNSSDPNALAVVTHGIAQVQSDGSAVVTAGDYLIIANTSGQAKTLATPGFAGTTVEEIIGIALNSVAATAGLLIDFLIQPMLVKP